MHPVVLPPHNFLTTDFMENRNTKEAPTQYNECLYKNVDFRLNDKTMGLISIYWLDIYILGRPPD